MALHVHDAYDVEVDPRSGPQGHESQTANSVGGFGPSAVPQLVEALRTTQNETTRGQIAYALGRIGARTSTAVDALTDALRNTQDEGARWQIVYRFVHFGLL